MCIEERWREDRRAYQSVSEGCFFSLSLSPLLSLLLYMSCVTAKSEISLTGDVVCLLSKEACCLVSFLCRRSQFAPMNGSVMSLINLKRGGWMTRACTRFSRAKRSSPMSKNPTNTHLSLGDEPRRSGVKNVFRDILGSMERENEERRRRQSSYFSFSLLHFPIVETVEVSSFHFLRRHMKRWLMGEGVQLPEWISASIDVSVPPLSKKLTQRLFYFHVFFFFCKPTRGHIREKDEEVIMF